MNDTPTIEERIAARTDLTIAGATEVSSAIGGLAFKDMGQVMEFSKLMAVAGQAVPKHLRGAPGACLRIVTEALNWRMDPFAVANKSYMVNDRIAYEAQLIHAVIEQRAPIKGRIKGRFDGEGAKRVCILTATSEEDGSIIEYKSPEIGTITTKNSPLWKSDPDQQLWYYSARAMCRRHFPDVLLGVYEKDEIKHAEGMRDVTPAPTGGWATKAREARGEALLPDISQEDETEATREEIEPEHDPETGEVEDAELVGVFDDDAVDPMTDEYDEGFKASQAALKEDACPHEPGTFEWNNWIGGYRFYAANKAKVEDEA